MSRFFSCGLVGLALVLSGCAGSAPKAALEPSPTETRLVELMTQRLELARQVAWIKFQNQAKVKGVKREAELLASLEQKAAAIGLARETARVFFQAQIQASCQVQQGLISGWKRGGVLPAIPPLDLQRDIRPRLEAISEELLRDLVVITRTPPDPGLARSAERTMVARGFSGAIAREASAPLRGR
ncbi:MAG: gamma subclass chorismate mutase AroQ [Verrucomicrobiota bacterium]